jgi:hypothetical protein
MSSLVMIFLTAFAACALIHLANRQSPQERAAARSLCGKLLAGAWVLALAQLWSLAKLAS